MNIVVTGVAPRCGTSAVMRLLLENGWEPHESLEKFPEYVAPEQNPDGFWDVSNEVRLGLPQLAMTGNECIKLWYPMFDLMDWTTVDLLLIMHRKDYVKQIKSILKCAVAEGLDVPLSRWPRVFNETNEAINTLDETVQQLRIPMPYLRSHPKSVLHKIKEIIQWQL